MLVWISHLSSLMREVMKWEKCSVSSDCWGAGVAKVFGGDGGTGVTVCWCGPWIGTPFEQPSSSEQSFTAATELALDPLISTGITVEWPIAGHAVTAGGAEHPLAAAVSITSDAVMAPDVRMSTSCQSGPCLLAFGKDPPADGPWAATTGSMGWFEKWFDEANWPKDPKLDPFRDAVWQLSSNGEVTGWVTTSVTPMRSLPFFWVKFECMWSQVHWIDGKHEDVEEDYSPEWFAVEELLSGHFTTVHSRFNRDGIFDAVVVTGPERDRLWTELGHGVNPSNG